MTIQSCRERISGNIITRFAPSPTGYLHLGHVASAFYVWGLAELFGAKVMIRFEDHDGERSRDEFEKSQFKDLEDLGFIARKETLSIERQSDDLSIYQEALKKIFSKDLVYPCFCSRKELVKRQIQGSPELFYNAHCFGKKQKEGLPHSLRLKVNESCQHFYDGFKGCVTQDIHKQCGDFVLKDRKGFWTYQFSSVVSDLHSGVNLIIRGEDIFESTGRQVYLQKCLDSKQETIYIHHPLIFDSLSKEKLSKSKGAKSIRDLFKLGHTKEDILGEAAYLVGLQKQRNKVKSEDLVHFFDKKSNII